MRLDPIVLVALYTNLDGVARDGGSIGHTCWNLSRLPAIPVMALFVPPRLPTLAFFSELLAGNLFQETLGVVAC